MSFEPTKTVFRALAIMLAAAALAGLWSQELSTFLTLMPPIFIVAAVCHRAGLLRL